VKVGPSSECDTLNAYVAGYPRSHTAPLAGAVTLMRGTAEMGADGANKCGDACGCKQ